MSKLALIPVVEISLTLLLKYLADSLIREYPDICYGKRKPKSRTQPCQPLRDMPSGSIRATSGSEHSQHLGIFGLAGGFSGRSDMLRTAGIQQRL